MRRFASMRKNGRCEFEVPEILALQRRALGAIRYVARLFCHAREEYAVW